MLIPIGQENSEVRRQPWVSYGLIAFNILVFLVMAASFNERAFMRSVMAKGAEVERYLGEHPYLELPGELARQLDDDDRRQLVELREGYRAAGRIPEPDVVRIEQSRLQALVDELYAARDRMPFRRLGFIPRRGGWLTALTCLFVHGGLLHLLGNMLFFFLSGPFVEDVFGRPLFAGLYLLSGLAGTLAHALKFPTSDVSLIGASGAIAGVMGAFLIRLGTSRIRFLYMPLFPFFWRLRFTFFMPAFVVLPLWFGEQIVYARNAGEQSGVGWWAHIGGFLFGAAVAGAVRLFGVEARYIRPAIESEISIEQNPGLEAALEARTRGEWDVARREIAKVLSAEPANVDGWIESCEIALGAGDAPELARSAARVLELHVQHGEPELARQHVQDVLARGGGALPVRFLMSAAGFLERDGDARGALDLYERVAGEAPADPAALRAMFRTGEILAKGGDPRGARAAFDRARAHAGWSEPLAAAAERALGLAEGRAPKHPA